MSQSPNLATSGRKVRSFSLRTGFVALTCLCLFLGWIFRDVQAQRHKDGIISRLRQHGFELREIQKGSTNALSAGAWLELLDKNYSNLVVSAKVSARLPSLEDWQDLAAVADLRELELQSDARVHIDPEALKVICQFPNLHRLSLCGVDLPFQRLSELRALKNLHSLQLDDTMVADGDLAALGRVYSVKFLSIAKCKVTDAGLTHLESLPQLYELDLSDNEITDAGLAKVHIPSLRHLIIERTKVTDQGVVELQLRNSALQVTLFEGETKRVRPSLERLNQISALSISGPFNTDSSLQWAARAAMLSELNMMNSRITDQGMNCLSTQAELRNLDLRGTSLTDHGLDSLLGLRKLNSLLLGSGITDVGVAKLSRIKSLEFLSLSSSEVSDLGLRRLGELHGLKRIWLSTPNVSGQAFESFAALPHLNSLWLHNMKLTHSAALNLSRLPSLEVLEIIRSEADQSAMQALSKSKLKHVSFFETPIDRACLVDLEGIPSLESVCLVNCSLHRDDTRQLLAARKGLRIWFKEGNERVTEIR